MKPRGITGKELRTYMMHLIEDEKSPITIEKYLRDVRAFVRFIGEQKLTKELVIAYKQHLIEGGRYETSSINSMLMGVNSFLKYFGKENCCVRCIKVQRKIYSTEEQLLNKDDYLRLLSASASQPQLQMIMKTICSTGIRVSELQYFTVEAVRKGTVTVMCKKKQREIIVPKQLKKQLLRYTEKQGIRSGIIFRSKNGNALNRSNIWKAMKQLCAAAGVMPSKVYPHNLRKLFARTFYKKERDLAKLADILGHSSINTTRIYIMTTMQEHRKSIERLGLV